MTGLGNLPLQQRILLPGLIVLILVALWIAGYFSETARDIFDAMRDVVKEHKIAFGIVGVLLVVLLFFT